MKLTKRQQEILDLISDSIVKTGAPPTRVEIANAFGFKSPNAAEDHLQALARKNAIELVSGTSRGIRLKGVASTKLYSNHILDTALSLPLIGRVAAGSPVLAQEHVARTYQIEASLFKQTPDYLLRVKGMSMRDVGIIEGDLLAVKKCSDARNGQIIVARIDGDVTVKRLQKDSAGVTLIAENPDFKPIHVTEANDFAIEGLAVGLIRDEAPN